MWTWPYTWSCAGLGGCEHGCLWHVYRRLLFAGLFWNNLQEKVSWHIKAWIADVKSAFLSDNKMTLKLHEHSVCKLHFSTINDPKEKNLHPWRAFEMVWNRVCSPVTKPQGTIKSKTCYILLEVGINIIKW